MRLTTYGSVGNPVADGTEASPPFTVYLEEGRTTTLSLSFSEPVRSIYSSTGVEITVDPFWSMTTTVTLTPTENTGSVTLLLLQGTVSFEFITTVPGEAETARGKMKVYAKVGRITKWRTGTPYVKVGNYWKPAVAVWVNDKGVWKRNQ